jgi:ketosteroid isomerase-like protein
MISTADFDALIEPYHQALGAMINGNPSAYKEIFSQRDDVTLGNPFGPFGRGRAEVEERLELAASKYSGGELGEFETVSKQVTPELAYLVEVERCRAKVGGREEATPVALRVTSIFRPEDGVWKLVHRHADPITDFRPADSVIQAERSQTRASEAEPTTPLGERSFARRAAATAAVQAAKRYSSRIWASLEGTYRAPGYCPKPLQMRGFRYRVGLS